MTAGLGRSALAYLVATILTGVTGLVLLPTYARALGPAAYGSLDLALALAALLATFGVAGIDTALGIAHFRDDPGTRPALASAALSVTVVVASVASVVGLVIAIPLVARVSPDIGVDAAIVVVALVVASATVRVAQTMLRQAFRSGGFLLVTIVQAGTTAAVGLSAVLVLGMGAVGAALGYGVGWAAGALTALLLLRVKPGVPGTRIAARRLLRLALPVAPAAVAMWLYALVDRFILAFFEGTGELGVYAAAARLAALAGLLVAAGQLAWGPFAMSISHHPLAGRFYAAALLVYSLLSAVVVIAAAVLARPVVTLLLGEEYAGAASVLWLLVAAVLLGGAYYIVAIGLNISERTGDIGRSTWLAALASVALNLVLIPPLGYHGAAIAAAASYALATSVVYVMAQRAHPVGYAPTTITAMWGVAVLAGAAFVLLDPVWRLVALAIAVVALFVLASRADLLGEARWAAAFLARPTEPSGRGAGTAEAG